MSRRRAAAPIPRSSREHWPDRPRPAEARGVAGPTSPGNAGAAAYRQLGEAYRALREYATIVAIDIFLMAGLQSGFGVVVVLALLFSVGTAALAGFLFALRARAVRCAEWRP